MVLHFYRKVSEKQENCFNVEVDGVLSYDELNLLEWLLKETFEPGNFGKSSFFNTENVVEVGPHLNFETPFSTNAVSICHSTGLGKVKRIEKSRRYLLDSGIDKEKFLTNSHDRMTECEYCEPLQSFEVNIIPEKVYSVPLLEEGPEALRKINSEMGLGMDDWDINFYYKMFTKEIRRNPTNVECFQLGQANSEHSRHWFFKGKMILDEQEKPETLFQIILSTLKANPKGSKIAFKDNSSAIAGFEIQTLIPLLPGRSSAMKLENAIYNPLFTAETHNFPCGVAPFPGAETGTGGRIRDTHATGKGSLVVAGTAGFCTGSLNIESYKIPGENNEFKYPDNLASPLQILIEESSGAYDYGNKFGEPCIAGFTRTFGLQLMNGERREWIKPIMFSGGVGQIDERHITKEKPIKDMLVVGLGGPAYRIGTGGGSASSMIQGENREELDFNAVQRGDAEMEQKMNRVIRACVEMGDNNPILSIHDQGAGGSCNVLTELVEPVGGEIDIRRIKVGDKTMSVLEIWGAEYQERNGLLISKTRISEFQKICKREKVNCEVLGEITGDGRIIVVDSSYCHSDRNKSLSRGVSEVEKSLSNATLGDLKRDPSTSFRFGRNDNVVVDLELEKILSKMPQKIFESNHTVLKLNPLKLPADLKIEQAIEKVFKLPSVGSKGFLVRKVDRSVTGLIVQQQCCGPLQLPVSDVSVIAQSHFGTTGAATAIGEQPIKGLIDSKAGARMALGEMLTNMVWAKISGIDQIKSSVNWMWAAKLEGEGALLYDAAVALRDLMVEIGVAADGGKDSLSMATKVGDELVKAPGQMVVSAYASVPDINKIVTPDIKKPGESKLLFIDLSGGKNRLGGSALAQAFGQIGDTSPDVDNSGLLKNVFNAVQELISKDLILSGHDRSDGGLITALSEMAMSGNCGIDINLIENKELMSQLFSEELGLIIEIENRIEIEDLLNQYEIQFVVLGFTTKERRVIVRHGEEVKLNIATEKLLKMWEATSDRLEEEQTDVELAREQAGNHDRPPGLKYNLTFQPEPTSADLLSEIDKPKVAIIREEGSNGDREMTSAFYMAGFEPWDVTTGDLKDGVTSLEQFRGIAFVGGFSYADVLDSAKGWAGAIKFDECLKEMFERFYERSDTFSLGVCNGCQLMALLGWVPWKGMEEIKQPRFIQNKSGRFESRWVNIKIMDSPSIMLRNMKGSNFGVWVAHGEGRLHCPDEETLINIRDKNLVPLAYVDDNVLATEKYPFNPNGSSFGIAGLCSPDGRHLAIMPHPERAFLKWQWSWMPEEWKRDLKESPWLKMFQNARKWIG